jgi:hypothetical protein
MHVLINVKSPHNISKWQMGFNSAFKGLTVTSCLIVGHIERMQGTRMVKAIYSWKPMSRRPIGRPKTRRVVDDVRKDIQKLTVPNWKTLAQDRGRWRELVEKAKTL